jgi:hypothetical protein
MIVALEWRECPTGSAMREDARDEGADDDDDDDDGVCR